MPICFPYFLIVYQKRCPVIALPLCDKEIVGLLFL